MNNPPGHPTLLRHPELDDVPFVTESFLDLPANAYSVEQSGDWWTVRVVATGEVVYQGPGPVTVFVSPAPF